MCERERDVYGYVWMCMDVYGYDDGADDDDDVDDDVGVESKGEDMNDISYRVVRLCKDPIQRTRVP
jgi:hypothetical protein